MWCNLLPPLCLDDRPLERCYAAIERQLASSDPARRRRDGLSFALGSGPAGSAEFHVGTGEP